MSSDDKEAVLLKYGIDISGMSQLSDWSETNVKPQSNLPYNLDLTNNLSKRVKRDKTNNLLIDQQSKLNKKNKRYENINTDSNSFDRINILKEQTTLKKDYTIETLKYILIFLMFSVLPLVLQRNKIIDENVSKIIFVASGIIIVIFLIGRFILNRKNYHFLKTDFGRNPNLSTNDPTKAAPESADSIAEDKQIAQMVNTSSGKGPIIKYLMLINEHMKKSVDAKDFDTAGYLQTYMQDIQIKLAEGDECGGIRPPGQDDSECNNATKQYIEQITNEYDFNQPVQQRINKLKAYQSKLSQLIDQKNTKLQQTNQQLDQVETEIDDYSSIEQIENEISQTRNLLNQLNNGLIVTGINSNILRDTAGLKPLPTPSQTPIPDASIADIMPTFSGNFEADDLKINKDVITALSVEDNN